jgi:hypothetical protein
MKQLHLILVIILILSSCKKEQPVPTTHYKTKFVHALSGTPLNGSLIEIQELVTRTGCAGWGCPIVPQYWGQQVTDGNGYIDFRGDGVFLYQPVEDSLWNPLPNQNPAPPPTFEAEVDQTCYLSPVTMLSLSAAKNGQFLTSMVNVDLPGGLPHFASITNFDSQAFSPSSSQETVVHLLRRVENKVTVKIYFADATTRDTVISITPTTGEKIRMELPY